MIGSDRRGSVGNGGHSWGVVDCGSGNSWNSVDGSDSWGSGVRGHWSGNSGGDWDSVGNSGDTGHSWSNSVGGDGWGSNCGGDWRVGHSGESWSSSVSGGNLSHGCSSGEGGNWGSVGNGGHGWSSGQANAIAGGADETSESTGGQSQNNAGTDLDRKNVSKRWQGT
ncbi:uncharacterized transmembrane protein DDB_G0289901-like [Dermacentor silvarum]|uniref:uncharacterized transmembrane protein DDB_G0289901-like n=1 Tax=Dermacentor silvarum TaxID=543639 RepID=UPI00189B0F1C|nr:uncharacterized transmembrane protein DDB_G0289901-like [Dermacentor silvarum]